MRSNRTPIVHDPGWIVAKTDLSTPITNTISDMRGHLRGIGIVQPPSKYPNRIPRERYFSTDKHEGTSPNMLVTRKNGVSYITAARRTRTHTNVRTVQHNKSKNAYELGLPSIHDGV